MSQSLMKILQDPSLLFDEERMKKKIEQVKQDKGSILKAADDCNQKYQREIDEGTEKRRLLLTDGAKKGLKEEDVMRQHGSFIPTKYTPILNWLYFMLRDENIDLEQEEARKKYNQQYGHLQDDYEYSQSGVLESPKEMDEFIYGNMSHEMFKKIKKLKALSRSSNENEAFIAYRMCMELCERYGLDIDKIPCNIERQRL